MSLELDFLSAWVWGTLSLRGPSFSCFPVLILLGLKEETLLEREVSPFFNLRELTFSLISARAFPNLDESLLPLPFSGLLNRGGPSSLNYFTFLFQFY